MKYIIILGGIAIILLCAATLLLLKLLDNDYEYKQRTHVSR